MKIERTQTTAALQPQHLGAALAAILASIPFTSAHAQERPAQDKSADLEEVTVTGSRIVRRDLVSNSPLVTVETDALEKQSGLNIESYLNQMPNFNPAAAPTVQTGPGSNSDVQISAVNSVGIASVSLRGFGPNRNLVLVNGHRPTPINALMVTDINSIPSALVKRIEIISGGASAVYGADAIGGVTNFILRDDFRGLEMDVQRGSTEVGDGDETRAYALMGTSIGEGRGLQLGSD
jgi:outer membrane cobalamin receptor